MSSEWGSGPLADDPQAWQAHQVALDKALVALKLLDHPAITPGIDEWSFVQTRLNRNMIDP
ncbi:hypothetical protein [Limibacillus halophilus]|uniref:Uncharacterized protein n=1 Tax=Limibacillus halophilus TaxID=1579333 RepID=A0A839ST74_9PROT|nr:hypothetical protein [Limibacillus halophilus]MBB3065189.1 hypothetical protein [Limibacillus halophilus]